MYDVYLMCSALYNFYWMSDFFHKTIETKVNNIYAQECEILFWLSGVIVGLIQFVMWVCCCFIYLCSITSFNYFLSDDLLLHWILSCPAFLLHRGLSFCAPDFFPSGRLLLLSLYIHKVHMGGYLTSPASILGRLCVPDPQEWGSLSLPALPLSVHSLEHRQVLCLSPKWQWQEYSNLHRVLGMSEFPAPSQWQQNLATYLCRVQDVWISCPSFRSG